MIKKWSIAIMAPILLFSLAACAGNSESKSSAPQETLVDEPAQVVKASGGFDAAVITADGANYTISAPSKFTPGKFATGHIPGQSYQAFAIAITNGAKTDLDLATLIVKGRIAGKECVDIFDGDNKIDGAPQAPLAANSTLAFRWALSCPGKSGDKLSVLLSNHGSAVVEITGNLA